MDVCSTNFDQYIADEVSKYDGVAVPIKAGLLSRLLIKKCACDKLHPNPDDEFCMPSVGPSYRIISEYEKKYLNMERVTSDYYNKEDPIIVEKIHPDGYMIINGHHRWAAALRLGYKKIPIHIVNVMHNQEIKEIIQHSKHNKRVTLDLDEVVFVNSDNAPKERPLPFPINKIFKEHIRRGIPALFRALEKNGFDIWIYSKNFYSREYLSILFKMYHSNVTNVVTGTNNRKNKEDRKSLESVYVDKYIYTLHIDNAGVLMIDNRSKKFCEFLINDPSTWSKDIINIIGDISTNEEP